jgi:hypothetical protein
MIFEPNYLSGIVASLSSFENEKRGEYLKTLSEIIKRYDLV